MYWQQKRTPSKLRTPVITYDKEETMRRFNQVGEILGDILPVRLSGVGYFAFGPWDEVSGTGIASNLLMDLVERPEFMPGIMRKLTQI